MNRRAFIKNSAFASLATALGGCATFSENGLVVNGIRIGVQMWSVNDIWKKNPVSAFRRLKAMGCDGVQSFGFLAMDWNELEKMLDGEGLQIVDMPFYMKNTKPGEFEKFIDFCHRFNIDFAFEPWIDFKTRAGWEQHAKELVEIGKRFAAEGIRVGYHNHQHELRNRYEGKSPMEILNESGIAFELDVGHVKLAKEDPVAWLKRLPGRVPSIHAKPGGGNSVGEARDQNDWSAIFEAAESAGTKWAIVECEARRNTFQDVDDSMNYLRNLNTYA